MANSKKITRTYQMSLDIKPFQDKLNEMMQGIATIEKVTENNMVTIALDPKIKNYDQIEHLLKAMTNRINIDFGVDEAQYNGLINRLNELKSVQEEITQKGFRPSLGAKGAVLQWQDLVKYANEELKVVEDINKEAEKLSANLASTKEKNASASLKDTVTAAYKIYKSLNEEVQQEFVSERWKKDGEAFLDLSKKAKLLNSSLEVLIKKSDQLDSDLLDTDELKQGSEEVSNVLSALQKQLPDVRKEVAELIEQTESQVTKFGSLADDGGIEALGKVVENFMHQMRDLENGRDPASYWITYKQALNQVKAAADETFESLNKLARWSPKSIDVSKDTGLSGIEYVANQKKQQAEIENTAGKSKKASSSMKEDAKLITASLKDILDPLKKIQEALENLPGLIHNAFVESEKLDLGNLVSAASNKETVTVNVDFQDDYLKELQQKLKDLTQTLSGDLTNNLPVEVSAKFKDNVQDDLRLEWGQIIQNWDTESTPKVPVLAELSSESTAHIEQQIKEFASSTDDNTIPKIPLDVELRNKGKEISPEDLATEIQTVIDAVKTTIEDHPITVQATLAEQTSETLSEQVAKAVNQSIEDLQRKIETIYYPVQVDHGPYEKLLKDLENVVTLYNNELITYHTEVDEGQLEAVRSKLLSLVSEVEVEFQDAWARIQANLNESLAAIDRAPERANVGIEAILDRKTLDQQLQDIEKEEGHNIYFRLGISEQAQTTFENDLNSYLAKIQTMVKKEVLSPTITNKRAFNTEIKNLITNAENSTRKIKLEATVKTGATAITREVNKIVSEVQKSIKSVKIPVTTEEGKAVKDLITGARKALEEKQGAQSVTIKLGGKGGLSDVEGSLKAIKNQIANLPKLVQDACAKINKSFSGVNTNALRAIKNSLNGIAESTKTLKDAGTIFKTVTYNTKEDKVTTDETEQTKRIQQKADAYQEVINKAKDLAANLDLVGLKENEIVKKYGLSTTQIEKFLMSYKAWILGIEQGIKAPQITIDLFTQGIRNTTAFVDELKSKIGSIGAIEGGLASIADDKLFKAIVQDGTEAHNVTKKFITEYESLAQMVQNGDLGSKSAADLELVQQQVRALITDLQQAAVSSTEVYEAIDSMFDMLDRSSYSKVTKEGVFEQYVGLDEAKIQELIEQIDMIFDHVSSGSVTSSEELRTLMQEFPKLLSELNATFAKGTPRQKGNAKLLDVIGIGDNALQEAKARITEWAKTIDGQLSRIDVGRVNKSGIVKLTAAFREQNGVVKSTAFEYNTLTGAIYDVGTAEKATLSFTERVTNAFKRQSAQLVATLGTAVSFYKLVSVFREGITTVKEIDTAMTELRKVSEATELQFASFEKQSFQLGASIGTTGKEIINAAADFSRLGLIR